MSTRDWILTLGLCLIASPSICVALFALNAYVVRRWRRR